MEDMRKLAMRKRRHAHCAPIPAACRTQVPNDPIVQPGNWMGAFGDRAYAEKAFKDPLVSRLRTRFR